jgi:integrase
VGRLQRHWQGRGDKGRPPAQIPRRVRHDVIALQGGMDLKTVQKLLGHKNLESTMRYLAKAQSAEVRVKVNLIWK